MWQKIVVIFLVVLFFLLELINQKLRSKRASDYSQKPILIAQAVCFLFTVVFVICFDHVLNAPRMLLGLMGSLLVLIVLKYSYRRTLYKGMKEAFEQHFGVNIASRLYICAQKQQIYAIANGEFIRIISGANGEDEMQIVPLDAMQETESAIYRLLQKNDCLRLF